VPQFDDPSASGEDAALPHRVPSASGTSVEDEVVERHRAGLLSVPGVTAVWSGLTPSGTTALFIGITDPSARARLPGVLEGYPVEIVDVPGGFVPLPADGGPSETP
jgi:hypothetical protein